MIERQNLNEYTRFFIQYREFPTARDGEDKIADKPCNDDTENPPAPGSIVKLSNPMSRNTSQRRKQNWLAYIALTLRIFAALQRYLRLFFQATHLLQDLTSLFSHITYQRKHTRITIRIQPSLLLSPSSPPNLQFQLIPDFPSQNVWTLRPVPPPLPNPRHFRVLRPAFTSRLRASRRR